MHAVDKLPRARRDLIDIWFYTAERWGEQQADDYLYRLDAAIQHLAHHPFLGEDYIDVLKGYRRHSAGMHRIFYRVSRHRIEIVRVLHARMDFSDRLLSEEI